jgi:hypothetical protein
VCQKCDNLTQYPIATFGQPKHNLLITLEYLVGCAGIEPTTNGLKVLADPSKHQVSRQVDFLAHLFSHPYVARGKILFKYT